MTHQVTVDVAGGADGGAGRFRLELLHYLARTGRLDVRLVGERRSVDPAWVIRRELGGPAGRRIATNNVGFIRPGGERWTLLRNALHFLTDREEAGLDPRVRPANSRKARMVRLTARRADVLVVPCTAMAERVITVLPELSSRVVVRMHPVSADLIPGRPRDQQILCPVLFRSYKHMAQRLTELAAAIAGLRDPHVKILVTADRAEVPAVLAATPQIELIGRLPHAELRPLWARSQAIYFPSGLESFGYPLAEARVSGHHVIALDTAQNREIAGPALCGFTVGDSMSLRAAAELALTTNVAPDPDPFEPDAYFDWLLGAPPGAGRRTGHRPPAGAKASPQPVRPGR